MPMGGRLLTLDNTVSRRVIVLFRSRDRPVAEEARPLLAGFSSCSGGGGATSPYSELVVARESDADDNVWVGEIA